MKHSFVGIDGGGLVIENGGDCITLTTTDICGERSAFHMNPLEFGSVAAALWECSPTKQPIKITGTPNDAEIKEIKEKDASSG